MLTWHGACVQVRNLASCIKTAIDFVSPESFKHVLELTQERRELTLQEAEKKPAEADKEITERIHADKLQVRPLLVLFWFPSLLLIYPSMPRPASGVTPVVVGGGLRSPAGRKEVVPCLLSQFVLTAHHDFCRRSSSS